MAKYQTSRTIVLMGTTGTGKSTLANSLLGFSIDPSAGDAPFPMSEGSESCTVHCTARNGHWLGDSSRPIRVIDTPGHGDSSGRDEGLREAIVGSMKAEKHVHAFVWVKNAEKPRVDAQDLEFLDLFQRIFGGAFLKNMIVVFTRFDQSESAERKRAMMGSSLDGIIANFRKAIRDEERREVPIVAIDAAHDPNDPKARQKYLDSCEELWRSIQTFSETPVERVENVKDKIATLRQELQDLRERVKANKERQEEETRKILQDFDQTLKEMKQEVAKLEQDFMSKLESVFQHREPLISSVKLISEEMNKLQEESEADEHLCEVELEKLEQKAENGKRDIQGRLEEENRKHRTEFEQFQKEGQERLSGLEEAIREKENELNKLRAEKVEEEKAYSAKLAELEKNKELEKKRLMQKGEDEMSAMHEKLCDEKKELEDRLKENRRKKEEELEELKKKRKEAFQKQLDETQDEVERGKIQLFQNYLGNWESKDIVLREKLKDMGRKMKTVKGKMMEGQKEEEAEDDAADECSSTRKLIEKLENEIERPVFWDK